MENEIIKRLIQVRNYFGESVYAFARTLNIPQPTLQRYETAERKVANKLLMALILICNININWLLTGKGSMFIKSNYNSFERQSDESIFEKINDAGKRLVLVQEKHNFLDKEMAKLLMITEKDYLKLVTGDIDFDIDVLNNIKKNFNVDIDWLLYGDEKTF